MTSKNLKKTTNKPIVTLYERVDKDKILRLLSSPELTDDEKNALHRYKQKILNNYVPVNYFYSKTCNNFGRLYAEGSISLQNFRKGIRHALADSLYDDIDMVNAHPVLLSQYCEKNNIKHKLLKDYVDNREVWLTNIMDFHCVSRDCAKKLILKLCYLGNYEIDPEDDNINRCCICHRFQQTEYINNGNVCHFCKNEGFKRLNDANKTIVDFDLFLIDLFNEFHGMNVCVNTSLKQLNDLIDEFYPPQLNKNFKLKKLEIFAEELKFIAECVYKIEKDISLIVKNDMNKLYKKSSVLSI